MYFDFTTIAAIFLLLTPASCAPARQGAQGAQAPQGAQGAQAPQGAQGACADVQSSSLELSQIVSHEARNGSKDVTNVSSSLLWIEAKDNCDPSSLKQKSGTCIKKIFAVLESYIFEVNQLHEDPSCSIHKVKSALHKLHTDMKRCVESRSGVNQKEESNVSTQTKRSQAGDWKNDLLCDYTMNRLLSFSILTARVFALGDPANHMEGSAGKCI